MCIVDSMTRLGDFKKFLVTWFLSKVAKMHGEILGDRTDKQRVSDVYRRQYDQIGRFLKVLGDMVSIKSSPNAW